MKTTRGNLADVVAFYMDDNDFDYVHIRASKSFDGSVKMVIFEDIEEE
jgi:hypothetical protein